MSSVIELNEQSWRFLNDESGRVKRAAEEALKTVGLEDTVLWSGDAVPRGPGGPQRADCVAVWSVKLRNVEREIGVCISEAAFRQLAKAPIALGTVVAKFAAAFEVFRLPIGAVTSN